MDRVIDVLAVIIAALVWGSLVVLLFGGCAHMEYATMEDHYKMMDECRSMCGEGRVQKYRPRSGECECSKEIQP